MQWNSSDCSLVLFDPVVLKFYLQWLIFLLGAGRRLLITSSCALMRSACGPGSRATSVTLIRGQETAAAIKSWAEIRYGTYGRHFRQQSGREKRAIRACSVIALQHRGRPDITWSAAMLSRSPCERDLRPGRWMRMLAGCFATQRQDLLLLVGFYCIVVFFF